MAGLLTRLFADIVNKDNEKEFEIAEQMYLQTYQQSLSWESLLAWKEAKKFGLFLKRKKNLVYTAGAGKDGGVFNTKDKDKLINYSEVEFETKTFQLDTVLKFGRKLDPVEDKFNPNLWAADIQQAIATELAFKRSKVIEIITKDTNISTIEGEKVSASNAMQIHDEIMDKIYENGFTPEETVVLASAEFIRGIRDKLQLQTGANDQINNVIKLSGAYKSIEGTTYFMVPKSVPIIKEDGSEGTISLLPQGVNAIAFKFSTKYDPLVLRVTDHTPLRVGSAALGTGMGNTLIMERVLYLGGGVAEPKLIILHKEKAKSGSTYSAERSEAKKTIETPVQPLNTQTTPKVVKGTKTVKPNDDKTEKSTTPKVDTKPTEQKPTTPKVDTKPTEQKPTTPKVDTKPTEQNSTQPTT